MKKTILIIISLIIGFFSGILYTVNTMQVDIVSETEEGVIIRIIVLNQWFNYFCEK